MNVPSKNQCWQLILTRINFTSRSSQRSLADGSRPGAKAAATFRQRCDGRWETTNSWRRLQSVLLRIRITDESLCHSAYQNHRLKSVPLSANPRDHRFSACRAKAAAATFCLLELISPDSLRRNYFLDDQLADLCPFSEFNCLCTRVVKQASDLTSIVGIDDTRQHVEPSLRRQTRSRRQPSVESFGNSYRQTGANDCALRGRQTNRLDRIKVQAGCSRTTTRRQNRPRLELHKV